MHLCYLEVITLCVCVRAGREIGHRPQNVGVAGIFCVWMCVCTLPYCTVEYERERDVHIAHAAHKHLLSHTSTCRDEGVTISVRMDGAGAGGSKKVRDGKPAQFRLLAKRLRA